MSSAEQGDSHNSVRESSNVKGRITLRISNEAGTRDLSVPDPAEISRFRRITPSQLHVLEFICSNIHSTAQFATSSESCASSGITQSNSFGVGETLHDSNRQTIVNTCSVFRLDVGMNPSTVTKFLGDIARITELTQTNPPRMYRFHERQQQIRRSPTKLRKKKLERALRSGNPFRIGTWKCCSRNQCFKRIGAERCYDEFRSVNSMTLKQAKRYLIGTYDPSEKIFRLNGAVVCSRFLAKCLGFCNDLQCSIKNTPRARGSAIAVSRPREQKTNTKRVFITLFIKRLAQMFGDAMPHKEYVTLPVLSRKELWKECDDAWRNSGKHNGDLKISRNYFYRIWRKFSSFVTIRKSTGFMVCSRCEALREEMAKHLRDDDTLVTLIEQHAAHLKFIEMERNAYEERQALAEQNPHRYCSIIVDGADQKNYGLPHFPNSTKSDSGHKLKVKVVGVLEHILRGQEWLSLFTMIEEYETGANHILEVVHQALQRKHNKLGKLPPVLFVQVDNCIRENKNRYFMAYFQSLVHLGVFKMVQISFLPIGHTHADIDQTFSSISSHLKINKAVTHSDLLQELEKCYARRVTASNLSRIINYSGLCEKTGCLSEVDSFSHYRYFRFLLKDRGSAAGFNSCSCDVKVRNNDTWVPFPNSAAEGFLKFVPSFAETPATKTRELSNEAQVTKCLESAEERVRDDSKIALLREMKDRVYHVREEPFHWNLSECFELSGNCVGDADTVVHNASSHVEGTLLQNYGYEPDDFVAVSTITDVNTRFWIGRVSCISQSDASNRARKLSIRWYVASGADPYAAKYTPAWRTIDGERTIYEDDIDVASVLVRFENLTAMGKLRARDKKAIKQTLNEN